MGGVMKRVLTSLACLLPLLSGVVAQAVVWPAPPAEPRVRHARSFDCGEWDRARGFWGKVAGIFGGSDADDVISLPLAVLATSERLYLTCQEIPGVVEFDPDKGSYRLHGCDEVPFESPIGLALAGQDILVADSATATLYRLRGDEVVPLVTEGLVRPTGVAYLAGPDRIYVVDTGDHAVKVFDTDGRSVSRIGSRGEDEGQLNFPTFAWAGQDMLLVNDTLNCRILRYAADGTLDGSCGTEGDRPGAFARPKGVAADAAGRVWVADAVFDNIQVFDAEGRVLLVIGSRGSSDGEFWSPAGLSILGREVYVADTFNNRIQVLEILGDDS